MNPEPLAKTVYDAVGWNALSDSPGWTATLAGLIVLAVAAAIAFGWREKRVAPRGWAGLLALRLAAIAAAALVLAGVQRRPLSEQEVPSRIVLLVDQSASMALPAGDGAATDSATGSADDRSRSAMAQPAVERLALALKSSHEVRTAGFDVAVRYQAPGANEAATDAGGATRLGTALQRVLSDHATSPLAAIVVLSDGGWNAGPEPAEPAAAAVARGVPIHTLGVGPLRQPPSVGLRDLAAPSRAATGDAFRTSVTVAANAAASLGAPTHQVRLALRSIGADDKPGPVVAESTLEAAPPTAGGLAGASDDLQGPAAGEYELTATLQPAGRDADPSDNRLTTRIEFIDQPTRVLLAASGPARDYRFLRDQLFRDDQFQCDVLLQSATGAVTQDAGRLLNALPATLQEWEAYDALVAIDVDWRLVPVASQEALAEWVSSRGGGLAFFAGAVSTPGCVRAGLESPLRTLLPVVLRDDPLALGASAGAPRDARPVRLTSAGEDLDWLDLRDDQAEPASVWPRFEGFYATTLPAEPKPGATLFATLDEAPDAAPLFVEQLYGAGRVVYGAATETWRLRKVDAGAFTALHVGLLRHLTQGRLLGADAEGGLLFDRRRYDLGDAMTIRYVARAPQPGAPSPTVRVVAAEAAPRELRLEPVDGQPGVFAATLRADAVGRYTATLAGTGGDRLASSAEVALPALENETRVQNVALLSELADQTGGRYVDLNDRRALEALNEIAQQTPSLAETTIELGPPDEAFAERLSRTALGVMAAALLLEWLLRRAWRLA